MKAMTGSGNDDRARFNEAFENLAMLIGDLPPDQRTRAVDGAVQMLQVLATFISNPVPTPPAGGSGSGGTPVATKCPKCNQAITIS